VDTQTRATTPARHGWQCPECGRQIPRHVGVCRCGVERKRLEALGYTFDAAPQTAAGGPVASEALLGPAGTLFGYRPDTSVARGWRVVLKTLFVLIVGLAGAAVVRYTLGDLPPTQQNVRIVSTLDAHTRSAGANATNTIPDFLALPGVTGILESSMAPTDLLKSVSETELRQGFCSQSIARQIRYQYPGFYETWPDSKLEVMVLEKYPEYQDRVCLLSSQIAADPDDIVKYEVKPRSLLGQAGLWLRTLAITALFAMALMNLYYRLLVNRLASA
jgi:hypothetical protein